MATYVLFGKYSAESAKRISARRTDKSVELIEELGGKLKSAYVLLGEPDLVFVLDLPNTEAAMKASGIEQPRIQTPRQ